MRGFREKIKDFLWYVVIYILITLGITQIILNSFGFSIPSFQLILLLIVAMILLELSLKRWYILPLSVFVTALVILSFFVTNSNLSLLFKDKYITLFQSLIHSHIDDSLSAYLLIPMLTVSIPIIGTITYLLVRKVSSFLPLCIFTVLFYTFAGIYNLEKVYFWAMVAFVGIFTKISNSYFSKKEEVPVATISSTAAILALIAILMSSSAIKEIKYPIDRTWRFLRMVASDINDVFVNNTRFAVASMPRDLFTAEQAGFTMEGGEIVPDKDPFLLVNAPSDTLLRGSIQNYYSGTGWYNTITRTQHRFESSFWNRELEETYCMNVSAWDDMPRELHRLLSVETVIEVKHTRQNTSSLYGAGRVYDVKSNVGDSIIPYFDMNGDMFSKYYVNANASYIVKTYLINHTADRFDEQMSRYISNEATYSEWIEACYLQIPETLPIEVENLTKDITDNIDGYYAKATAIRDYLSDFTYTLSPEVVPDDSDFVDFFLQTKQGYCTYFASAMVIMARSAGIPARYVQGFYVPEHLFATPVYLTGENAHAWAELYFDGIGWIPFDATPRDVFVEQVSYSDMPIFNQTIQDKEMDNYHLNQDIDFIADSVNNNLDKKVLKRNLTVLAVISLLIFIILLPYFIFRISLSKRYIRRRFPNERLRLEKYYENALGILKAFDSSIVPGDTPNVIARKFIYQSEVSFNDISRLTAIVVRMRYEDIPPTEDDFETIHEITLEMERSYRHLIGLISYYRLRLMVRTAFRSSLYA